MPTVELDTQEWQQVLGMISAAPWRDANPLLMKIGAQLQPQEASPKGPPSIKADRNGKEVRHGQ